jgi:hypothetical protein
MLEGNAIGAYVTKRRLRMMRALAHALYSAT